MSRRIPAAVALLFAAAAPAHAAVICVADADTLVEQLAAASVDPADDEIRVRSGTYLLGGRPVSHSAEDSGSLTLSGGWGAGCAARTANPALTVLDGQNNARASLLAQDGDLDVSFLTFVRFAATEPVPMQLGAARGRRVRLAYSRFLENRGPISVNGLAEFDVHDNVFARNVAHPNLGCNFRVFADPIARSAPGRYVHNTFAFNERPFCLVNSSRHAVVANNVFWGAAGQVQFASTNAQRPALFVANIYDQDAGTPLLPAALGNMNADPLFLDPAIDDYRLKGGSPATDRGVPGVAGGLPSIDPAQGTRPAGVRPDIGAFEAGGNAAPRVVSTTGDAGAGTLRQAILDANASGIPAQISFSLGGTCGPHVITLGTPLPTPTVPVSIDGYTQAGATKNTAAEGGFDAKLCVVLRAGAGTTQAFQVDGANAAPLTLRGLAFDGFSFAAINLRAGYGHAIEGNQFGGSLVANGAALQPNGIGVQVALDARGVAIGGAPYERGRLPAGERTRLNWFAGGTTAAIAFSASDGRSTASGNLIGDPTNQPSWYGTGTGVRIVGSVYRVAGNVLNGLAADGIVATGSGAQHALIDGNAMGILPVAANTSSGSSVRFSGGASDHVVGLPGRANQLGVGGPANVWIESGQRVSVAGNRLASLAADPSRQNVELGALGPEPNDTGDADGGANAGQNRAENIVFDVDVAGTLMVSFDLGTAGPVDVEIVSAPACASGLRPDADATEALLANVPVVAGRVAGLQAGRFEDFAERLAIIVTSADGSSEISECASRPLKAPLLGDGFEGEDG